HETEIPPFFVSLLFVVLLFTGKAASGLVLGTRLFLQSSLWVWKSGVGQKTSKPWSTEPIFPAEPNYKIIKCKRNEGNCKEYCNFMETQVGYCLREKEACYLCIK
uniref:Uncharacterized protein n=1 Tax=Peromyscus maniculatus bairdii TaxID=230844 RepID=A0A8C8TZE2_PERMB